MKTITMPYNEYSQELSDAKNYAKIEGFNRGFDEALLILHNAKCGMDSNIGNTFNLKNEKILYALIDFLKKHGQREELK